MREELFTVMHMRFKTIAALLCTLAATPHAVADAPSSQSLFGDWSPYVEIDLWRASDAVTISEFESDWSKGYSPRSGRNVALMRNRAAAGVESGQWRLGYEVRQEASLRTDRETLEMVRLYKQRQDPDSPTSFNARVRYKNWYARGLRVGRHIDGPMIAGRPVRTLVSAAWYSDSRYRQNDASGSVSYLGGGDYTFNATELDIDSRARLPFLNDKPEATGASVSVAAEIPLSAAFTLNVKIDDLWSRMRWRNLPETRQTINSNVTDTDSEGYVNYRPLLSGRNRQIDTTLEIPRYASAELSYVSGDWRYAAQLQHFASITIPTFSAARRFGWGTVSARIETRFKSIGVGYALGNFHVLVQTDAIDQDKANAQAIQLAYSRAF